MKRGFARVVIWLTAAAIGSILATTAAQAFSSSFTPIKKRDARRADPRSDMSGASGKVVVARYGPYDVPAAQGTPTHKAFFNQVQAPCVECAVTDIVPDLVYADGSRANFDTQAMLHHFVMFNPERNDVTCPDGLFGTLKLGERFFASGNERSHTHLPRRYGYGNSSTNWLMETELMNMSSTNAKQLYVEITFRYRPLRRHTRTVTPLWLDVDNCGDSEYSIPTGYSDTHWDWTSPLTGYVVGLGGHLHENANQGSEGTALSAEIPGGPADDYFGPIPPSKSKPADLTGATLCRSEPSKGTSVGNAMGFIGRLDTMSQCGTARGLPRTAQPEAYPSGAKLPKRGYPLHAGDTVRLHSEYLNTGAPRDDVMGIMVTYLYETQLP